MDTNQVIALAQSAKREFLGWLENEALHAQDIAVEEIAKRMKLEYQLRQSEQALHELAVAYLKLQHQLDRFSGKEVKC